MNEKVRLGDIINLISRGGNTYMVLTWDGDRVLYDSENSEKYRGKFEKESARLFCDLTVYKLCNGKTRPKFYILVDDEGLYEAEAEAQPTMKRERLKDYVIVKDNKPLNLYKGADGKICYRYKRKWIQIKENNLQKDIRCVRLYHDGWDYYRTHPNAQYKEMGGD